LEIAVGEKTELYNKSRELTFVNPDTPEEIKNYAERCFAFVEENLGIRYSWKYADVDTNSNWEDFVSRFIVLTEFRENYNRPFLVPAEELKFAKELREMLKPS
jgi:hypothetical protein